MVTKQGEYLLNKAKRFRGQSKMKTPQQIRNEVEKEIRTNMEIIEVIQLLKKDNHKNILSAKKEGKMLNWDIDKVETIVNLYLDCVLSMLKLNVEVSNSK